METTTALHESFVTEGYDFQYLLRQPATKSTKQKGIILLHGVGGNEKDIFSLKLHLPKDWVFISPRGPYVLGEGIFAWYEVDFASGKPVINVEEETQSRQKLVKFIAQLKETYMLDEIYLGGFSQGGIMSYTIGLLHPELINGLVILSSRMLPEITPLVTKKPAHGNLRVFVAHGTLDASMSVSCAREAKEFLQNLGVQLSYHEYMLGHQINKKIVKDLVAWLS
ncbi:alpha/beta hydrolase [Pedobacter immunditicola]|uniref:alpha/beta hydrolase n=1 Tax=Pedobacter immunditicola TaxID=3133440 RepID=UPI0030A3902F